MDISLFDYQLPKELIAQEPIEPRDHSRLMVLDRETQSINHAYFYKIIDFLKQDDVLIFNNSKVVPARLLGHKKDTQGKAELLLIRPLNSEIFDFQNWPQQWYAIGKPELKIGQIIEFNNGLEAKIIEHSNYELKIEFNATGDSLQKLIREIGQMPLPPYIEQPTDRSFKEYQTVYAQKEGSIAAPTAGFHFTQDLLNKIKTKRIQMEYIVLHVGLGTFLPVKEQQIENHLMHAEYFEISDEVARRLNTAKQKGQRIISVGTTVVRVLENCASDNGILESQRGWTKLFIYPGYKFKFVDALITNFHLPKSTLLMLVSAFAGREFILKAYQEAIKQKYRFFSFGDAMFIQ
ncbi:MAG: tRNA preQ1(34) S-adenosylmethionine ribosyltransferase-isomerase QueA [Parcubacteria group bacterium]|nr:tRNA preQ1(34) S-adenosylmethionine ribosyltransferase-isomerase QueA [Parcubacteria group bacterium]